MDVSKLGCSTNWNKGDVMALLWIDGFEGYGASGYIGPYLGYRGWSGATNNITLQPGRLFGYAAQYGSTWSISTPNLTTNPTMIIGWAFYATGTIASYAELYYLSTLGIGVIVTPSTITVKLGATAIATWSATTLLTNIWYYIEAKVFCHSSSGTVEVRLNGVTIITLSGINTQTGAEAYYSGVKMTHTSPTWFDDFYVCDGSGTRCNDFQGVCKVIGIFPSSDTATEQWTPSTGTAHYACVDENPPAAADYVSTSTQANTDLYGYPSLVGATGTILGLQVSTTMLLAAGTSIILESPIVSNGIIDLGPDFQLTSATSVDARHISMTDPNTSDTWTIAGLAAAQIGIKAM